MTSIFNQELLPISTANNLITHVLVIINFSNFPFDASKELINFSHDNSESNGGLILCAYGKIGNTVYSTERETCMRNFYMDNTILTY